MCLGCLEFDGFGFGFASGGFCLWGIWLVGLGFVGWCCVVIGDSEVGVFWFACGGWVWVWVWVLNLVCGVLDVDGYAWWGFVVLVVACG